MKFEEVLPALREGKKIRRKCMPYGYCHIKNNHIVRENGRLYTFGVDVDILQDDWEIVEEKKKVKLRDLTEEQFKSYCNRLKENGSNKPNCHKCMFKNIGCGDWHPSCWVKHKDLYSDKFLDQEIEIEEE